MPINVSTSSSPTINNVISFNKILIEGTDSAKDYCEDIYSDIQETNVYIAVTDQTSRLSAFIYVYNFTDKTYWSSTLVRF